MPITNPRIVDDPLAPLAWSASLAILALDKLSTGDQINEEESGAVQKVLTAVGSLSKASQLHAEDLLGGHKPLAPGLLTGLSALTAIVDVDLQPSTAFQFDQTVDSLRYIVNWLDSDRTQVVDLTRVKMAQDDCLAILEQVNAHRPFKSAELRLGDN